MAGSSAPLRRLGAELRRLREATGRTQTDVGAEIGRTHATLVNWELGKTKISKSDLVCLLAELRAPTEVRKGLEQLRQDSNQGKSQWAVYGLPDWLRPLVSFEEDAIALSTFEPVIIPGLLQTEEYARATHLTAPHVVAPQDVDRWVAARQQRQRRLDEVNPLRLHAVIAEAALRLRVGGPEVMAAQLARLCEAAETANVTIQVLPSTRGELAGVASNFTVLHFADPGVDPPLGYFDGPLGGYLISDEGDVAAMIKMFADLGAPALNEADSLSLLSAILAEYR
ncbi:helix-turn-helix protein [Tamaricihabitans halophyticus]|uniref:Helix-turn-helix protein n=1 Tax=Tamaricihabitans halophyticus TaxID=1262583 RepID=A0A4R2R6A4_9PSEU|nr:helix-turn-helix transcriptional regulator [Tamaricihabitans halophyticus]TCP57358.1 helix-turn-helix protein [Tamaricihabitans halophyticus]